MRIPERDVTYIVLSVYLPTLTNFRLLVLSDVFVE